jgi:hypothetical protein
MKTLFLLGILGALIVIATKDNNQTAMEAAMEIGQKAQSIVSEYDRAKIVNTVRKKVKETSNTASKKVDPFIRQAKEAIAKSKKDSPRKMSEPENYTITEKITPPAPIKQAVKKITPPEEPDWTMPKPRKLAIPEIPAMPKAAVEELALGTNVAVRVAKVEPTSINVGHSYDLVKGYYENASRLLEEIK